jgi:hypothetical protein
MGDRILAGMQLASATSPAVLRLAVRGWVGFAEAAALDWLEQGGLGREELGALLVRTLRGALRAAAEIDPAVGLEAAAAAEAVA